MKQEMCCGQSMRVKPIKDDIGLLFSYQCDICKDGFSIDPGEAQEDVLLKYSMLQTDQERKEFVDEIKKRMLG